MSGRYSALAMEDVTMNPFGDVPPVRAAQANAVMASRALVAAVGLMRDEARAREAAERFADDTQPAGAIAPAPESAG